jgi:hypothetical protein
MRIFSLVIIIGAIFAGSSGYYYFYNDSPQPYYTQSNKKNDRSLSSKKGLKYLSLFEDFFSVRDYFMFINQKMDINIKGINKSLQKSIINDFLKEKFASLESPNQNTAQFFSPTPDFLYQLTHHIAGKYPSKTWSGEKKEIHLELRFYPKKSFGLGPSKALKGQFFSIDKKRGEKPSPKNLGQIMSKTLIPFEKGPLQAVGGSITIKYDTTTQTGQICYRRYFRVNDKGQYKLTLNPSSLKMEYFHFKKIKKKQQIMTVDLFQSISNLETPPTDILLKIYIDGIVESDPFEKGFLKKIKNSKFILRGNITHQKKVFQTITYINSLIYSFEENKFLSDSEIVTNSNHSEYQSLSREISNQIKNIILVENKDLIIKNFFLRRFSNEVH